MISESEISRTKLRSILAATDLSDNAASACRWAVALADDHRASLHLLNAAQLGGWSSDYQEIDAGLASQVRKATRERLEELARSPRERGLPVTCQVSIGEPSEIILNAAKRRRADLVVVGARGQRGLDSLLLGGTTERVVQRARCPVLTVPLHDSPRQRPIRRLLVATDFSAESAAALRAALALCGSRAGEARLILLHAYQVPYDLMSTDGYVSAAAGQEQWQAVRSEVEQRLDSAAAPFYHTGASIEIKGIEGRAAEVIIDEAAREAVDLIAMGTRGRTGLSHVLLGSTAERIIHRAPCPVLTVRRPTQRSQGGNHAG